MKKLLKITLTVLFTTILLLGFAIPVNMPNGTWYQQFFPNLNGRVISDITFFDSLNGFAVTKYSANDTNYILKSTNSGDNWSIVYRQYTSSIRPFNKVQFLNKDTGFVGGNRLLKTTNSGLNWTSLTLPSGTNTIGLHVLNEDTIWFADDIPFDGGLFRSTNKGLNWERQYDAGPAPNPDHVYMYNGKIGFMTRSSNLLYKTTNSGVNWFTIPGGTWLDIKFIDSLTGWKANQSGNIAKTIDGGNNWTNQTLPNGGIILNTGISSFSILSPDTLWGSGGNVFYGGGRVRGILYKTTNSGINWLFQIPDTSFGIGIYYKVQFLSQKIAWGYGSSGNSYNIHTTNGGDTTFLIGLQQISTQVPKDFKLFQNYPNPFNPATKIKYSVTSNVKGQMSNVKLSIYDITGKEIIVLVNQKQNAGTYEVDWNASGYSSGVYFCSLLIGAVPVAINKMILLK